MEKPTLMMLSILALMGMPAYAAILAPTATNSAANHDHRGWSPRPTNPPGVLELRQAQPALYAMAPDNICGWASYSFKTSCVGASESCDSRCSSNQAIRRCEGDTPFCHPVNYVATDSFHGFTCAKTAFSRGQRTALLQTTFSGATTTRNYGLFGATASGAAPGTGTDEDNAVEQISSPTDAGGGGSGGDRGDGGGGGDSQSSTPIGAIVGGVVGGISVIAIAAGAGAFVYRRKKKRSQDIGGQAVVQPENTDTRSPKWPLLNAGQAAKIPEYPLEMDAAVPATQVHELGDTGHPNSSPPARQVHELG
ncbi:hypothetical protein MGG_16233 [Pyricularia oryzae 70-15]|uniref:Mid2 domain-containing protein n=1 Tax=Pyricularia oryzae (strain 70-15 / ATCC MYA-4617 / FGSC 8958) TaxID=242507 RepID=G4MNW9_PYRO7|nr:uncharacterized protein MGG_16233 [Pyricularia oryzae 70-15]EHA57126.1 hypothetical protein MGG_16233 [Pyricularia oryzae 70-15]